MKEYLEFKIALDQLLTMGYSIGLAYNQSLKDWRCIATFPGVGTLPWVARGKTLEEAFAAVAIQIRTGLRVKTTV